MAWRGVALPLAAGLFAVEQLTRRVTNVWLTLTATDVYADGVIPDTKVVFEAPRSSKGGYLITDFHVV